MDFSRATKVSGNARSTVDSIDLDHGLDIGAGTGKATTFVTTGQVLADTPTDSIMYAQEVEVSTEGRK